MLRDRADDSAVSSHRIAALLSNGESEFRRLLERLPAAAYTCDADGLITFYNRLAAELWGRAPLLNDPRDRFCGSFKLFSPDGASVPHEECWMALALRSNQEYNGHEIVIERRDGARITALAHACPIRDHMGSTVGAFNVLIDITDRKRLEESLKEADRHKDEFLAILAHELRGPLAPVRNSLEIIKLARDNQALVDTASATLDRQLSQVERLVDDLLDISRIAENKLELRRQKVSLASVVVRAVEMCTPKAMESNHRIAVHMPSEPIYLYADSTRLTQVFSNLLNNACRYTDFGGSIRLSAERKGDEVLVTVVDDGIGIPADMLPHIFGMYTQAAPARKRAEGGLGLGLALVRRLIQLHDGSVEAFSEGIGKGSRFSVHLPLMSEERDAPSSLLPVRIGAALDSRRILVVDDDRDSAQSLALLLEVSGHVTQVSHDGVSALEAAESFQPGVILLDLDLPRLNGHEVARRIREKTWGQGITLVAVTGWHREEDLERSKEVGFDHLIMKPLKYEIIAALL